MEDAFVCHFDTGMISLQKFPLYIREVGTNFNNVVARPLVYVWMLFLQIVQNVPGQCTVTGADFIDDEILVWEVFEQIFGNETLRYGLAIPRLDSLLAFSMI